MPRLLEKSRRFAISTNMKVMYSSLCAHDHLEEVSEAQFGRAILSRRMPHLLLTRDPKARLISAFRDKFRNQPRVLGQPEFHGWQRIHQVHYKHLGLKETDSDEVKQARFLKMTFGEFVALLPKTRLLDGHLRPQYLLQRLRFKRLIPVAPARVTHVIPMEGLDPSAALKQWGIDVGERRNVTPKGGSEPFDDATADATIARVYGRDYGLFYSQQ
jgi:hypothetical protein